MSYIQKLKVCKKISDTHPRRRVLVLATMIIMSLAGCKKSDPPPDRTGYKRWVFMGLPGQEIIPFYYTLNKPMCGSGSMYLCAVIAKEDPTSPDKPDLTTVVEKEYRD